MRKLIYFSSLILLLAPALLHAQGQTYTVAQAQADANKKASGNKEDLLTNYIQVAANNLTSTNQNLTLKLNWFALNATDSATKYNDINYQKTRWQRNGQFLLGGGMDKNSRFNSVQGGISYNIVNLRDTTEFNYYQYYDKAMDEIALIKAKEVKVFKQTVIDALRAAIDKTVLDESQKKEQDQLKSDLYSTIKSYPTDATAVFLIRAEQDELNKGIAADKQQIDTAGAGRLARYGASYMLDIALNKYTTSLGKQSISFDGYVDAALIKKITDAIDQDIKGDPLLQQQYKAKGMADVEQQIETKYKNLVSWVSRQPVVTAALNGNYGTGSSLSSIGGGFSGIWGLNKLGSKKTNQLTASLSDTLTEKASDKARSLNRDLAAAQAGINTVLLMDKNTSVMELNMGVEDDVLFGTLATGANRNKFSFNATYRARLPGSPWLKFTIKYDPKAANVLGLLNFTYNLDNSSSTKK